MKDNKKILLVAINAKYIHSNPGIYSLKKYADVYGDNIEIAEYTINHEKRYILEEIYKRHGDVVAFSCYIWNYQYVLEISRELNKISPNTKIWFGGPEVTYDAYGVLSKNPWVSLIMRGEGEGTFKELLDCLFEGTADKKDILGITYREADRILENPDRSLLDMNDIPFYYDDVKTFENRIVYYEASRGCPFSCSYCLSSIERKVRFRDINTVKRELKFFIDSSVPQVKFVDRTFNINHDFTMEIWKFILENNNGITGFHFEVSADLLKDDQLDLLEKMPPGLVQLEIGVQSTNDATIKEIDRTMNLDRLYEVVRRIKKGNNVHQHLDLIAGLPKEDFQSFKKSYDEVFALRPHQLQLGFLKVLKGSKMERMAGEYEIKYLSNPPYEVLSTKELTFDEIMQIKLVEEMTEDYYNSAQFEKTLELLVRLSKSPFEMFLDLGEYYEKNELLGISQSRMKRYEILLEYIKEKHCEYIEEFKERMLFDLYSRENLKSRPEWLWPLDNKGFAREFFENPENIDKYLNGYVGYTTKQIMRMTHLEYFSMDYTNEAISDSHEKVKGAWLLFDYSCRNAMNHSARIIKIDG